MAQCARRVALAVALVSLAAAPAADAAAAAAAKGSALTSELLAALEAALDEESAKKVIEPHMTDLKKLEAVVVERVVSRQWWGLARDIVSASHTQQVDLSFAVRKAVRTLKEEADELLRTLNPKYGMAQQVSPAFQWAQNDTCIFLTIKYTVRWNAPGALEVTDPSVNFTDNRFTFSGLGKHSNNKYKYFLNLTLFDRINTEASQWSAASVGKLSVTLRKLWPRKWPRLLDNKKTKIGNMHVWMEMQEKLESQLSGMNSVANSPVTCRANDKLYCLATDTCKKPGNCSQCPGKSMPVPDEGLCAGVPTEKGSISFKDSDMDQHQVGGEVKITKARNEFDIDAYEVYWGKDDRTRLEDANGQFVPVGTIAPTGSDAEFKIPSNTAVPDMATHLLLYSKNRFGEFGTPGHVLLVDAVLPKYKPTGVRFEDDDGDKGYIGGTVTISKAENEEQIDEYALHWGKTATRKIGSGSSIRTVTKSIGDSDPTHHITKNTKIPDSASYILAFSKNSHGEYPFATSVKIVDNVKPCTNKTDEDCPSAVAAMREGAEILITMEPAKKEGDIEKYTLYWGRSDCEQGGQEGAKNGHIQDVPKEEAASVVRIPADTTIPSGTTHVLAFSKNRYGESDHCVATSFEGSNDKKEL